MMLRLSSATLTDILFWIFIEGLLAARRAEVIGLSFVLRRTSRGLGVNVHSTNGIMHCICHTTLSFHYDLIILLNRPLQQRLYYQKSIGNFAYSAHI